MLLLSKYPELENDVFYSTKLVPKILSYFKELCEVGILNPEVEWKEDKFSSINLYHESLIITMEFASTFLNTHWKIIYKGGYLESLSTLMSQNFCVKDTLIWNCWCYALYWVLDYRNTIHITDFSVALENISKEIRERKSSNYSSLLVVLNLLKRQPYNFKEDHIKCVSYVLDKIPDLETIVLDIF